PPAVRENPIRRLPGGLFVGRLAQEPAGEREGGDRQRGPIRQQLVVGLRRHTERARLVHLLAGPREKSSDLILGLAELRRELRDAPDDREDRLPVLEISALSDSEPRRDDRRTIPATSLQDCAATTDLVNAILLPRVRVTCKYT